MIILIFGKTDTHKPSAPNVVYRSLGSRHCVSACLLILKATGGCSISMFLYPLTAFNLQAASVRAKYIFGLTLSLLPDSLSPIPCEMTFVHNYLCGIFMLNCACWSWFCQDLFPYSVLFLRFLSLSLIFLDICYYLFVLFFLPTFVSEIVTLIHSF